MAKKLTNKMLQAMHLKMVRIRRFEEEAGRLMEDGKIPGALHLYVGQEAVASGVMQHLADDDYITSTHRGHGHLIAKGGDFSKMFAELFGKATGYCKGKGGKYAYFQYGPWNAWREWHCGWRSAHRYGCGVLQSVSEDKASISGVFRRWGEQRRQLS